MVMLLAVCSSHDLTTATAAAASQGGPHKAKGGVKKATAAKQRPGKGRRQAMKGKGGGKR